MAAAWDQLRTLNDLLVDNGLPRRRSIANARHDVLEFAATTLGIHGTIAHVYRALTAPAPRAPRAPRVPRAERAPRGLSVPRVRRAPVEPPLPPEPPAPPAPEFRPPTRWETRPEVRQERQERLEQLERQRQAIQDEIDAIQQLEGIEIAEEAERPTREQRLARYRKTPHFQRRQDKLSYEEWARSTTDRAQADLVQRYLDSVITRNARGEITKITFRFDDLTSFGLRMVFIHYREMLDGLVRTLQGDD
jgi:hypothetical protein